jgi:hypothetical protein
MLVLPAMSRIRHSEVNIRPRAADIRRSARSSGEPVRPRSSRMGQRSSWRVSLSKQREILEAVGSHRYVAVKSAHDTGKSHSASRAVAWWARYQRRPFATTTAPTTKQVHAILWRYIGQAHRKGYLSGRITLDDEWYMGQSGKSWSPLAASRLTMINRPSRDSCAEPTDLGRRGLRRSKFDLRCRRCLGH